MLFFKKISGLILFQFLIGIYAHTQSPTIGILYNDSLSFNGYSLFSSTRQTYLIDNCGQKVNEWTSTYQPGLSVYLLENGNLLRCGRVGGTFQGGGVGGIIEEFNWDGQLQWSFLIADSQHHQHHDIEPLPNGNILVIVWELKTSAQADAAGAANFNEYWPDAIWELKKVGPNNAEIVWKWHTWDHLVQEADSTKANYGTVSEHPELIDINFNPPSGGNGGDWQHCNSIDFNPERDEIIISSRSFNEFFIIDHSTTTAEAAGHTGGNRGKGGDLLYRFGNQRAYGKGSNFHQKLFGQHNATIIPKDFPNEGKVLVFNNGAGRPGGNYSTSDMVELPIDANGDYYLDSTGVFGPDSLFWTYQASPPNALFSSNQGGTQALSNGNVLITSSTQGIYREVSPSGQIVWLYQNPIGPNGPLEQGVQPSNQNTSRAFRIERYGPDFAGFLGKDLKPGAVLELNPYPPTCVLNDGTVHTKAKPPLLEGISLFPTFTSDFFNIKKPDQNTLNLRIFDLGGQLWAKQQISAETDKIDIRNLPNGLYIVLCSDILNKTYFSQKIIKL